MDKIKENLIRELIKKTIAETLIKKSISWEEQKPKFKETITSLISKIDDNSYEDAEDLLGSAISMLQSWKSKINKAVLDEEN
jgi:hypothetical protein